MSVRVANRLMLILHRRCSSGMPGSSDSTPLTHSDKICCAKKKTNQLLKSLQNDFQTNSHGCRQVVIRDLDLTKSKLESLFNGGPSNFQVISDFDHTISRYHYDNHKAPTCHGIFELDPEVTSDAKLKFKQLRDKYYPIEIDPKLSGESKTPFMIDWWQQAHEAIIKCGITRSGLDKTVRECGLVSRENVDQFFQLSHKHRIPILIFSAGLGDVIQLYLEHVGLNYDNVRIVSNFMIFNDQDLLVDFASPIIHSFNKNATCLNSGDHDSRRSNILLIGDSAGDVQMADGLIDEQQSGVVLRIGFLNDAIEANLDRFESLFDIVLVNDNTFDIPLKIVQSLLDN